MDTNRATIKVMADHECFPLWQQNADGLANIDPGTLPIPPDLVRDLLAWADVFDRTLNRSDPANSGFPDTTAEATFYAEGERLVRQPGFVM